MSATITNTAARTLAALAAAEDDLAAARRREAGATRTADRAALRTRTARADLAEARRALRAAERTGKGVRTASRRLAAREDRLTALVEAARIYKAETTATRRARSTAERRVERIARRAALAAARSVEKITTALGEATLTPAPDKDPVLPAAEIPAVEEIEAHAARQAKLDREAKELAKLADAEKDWLRRLPTGTYGRVVITRTPGRSLLDGTAVALAYTSRGEIPPRKTSRTTFKCDASALLADQAAQAQAADLIMAA